MIREPAQPHDPPGSDPGRAADPLAEGGDHPQVSVIIPAFNAAAFIGGAVRSVFCQTLTDWELIIIDDGSEDPPALDAVLAPYGERIRLIRQANAGVAAARNTGLLAASGHYVAFLDSDDGWEPGYLAAQVSILEAAPALTLSYCDATLRGDAGRGAGTAMELSPSTGEPDLLALVSLRCTVLTSSTVVRREPVLAAGGFDARLTVSEDFELWLRLLLAGHRFTFHTQPLAWRTLRPGSLSSVTGRINRAAIEILQKHRPALEQHPGVWQAAEATIRHLRRAGETALARRALRRGEYEAARHHLLEARRSGGGIKLRLASWVAAHWPGLLKRVVAWQAEHRTGQGPGQHLDRREGAKSRRQNASRRLAPD